MSELPLQGKTIVLGVSGSIAAYKGADICSKLKQAGADVYPILTPGAEKFITSATFAALAHRPVSVGVWDEVFGAEHIAHLRYGEIADLFLIAPASANLLARLATGNTSDMLSAALLGNPDKPILLAPAMNTHMWTHPATRRNVEILRSWHCEFVEPEHGRLAEGYAGIGRLASTETILQAVQSVLSPARDLTGVRVLVTAGPTREALDPVRFLSNRSSGKMGYAIASEAARRGAQVTLVSGPTSQHAPLNLYEMVRVTSAGDMADAVFARSEQMHVIVASAAVADYTPDIVATQKIKKDHSGTLTLSLRPTEDILGTLGARKQPGQMLVGFAAETHDLPAYARAKFTAKNLDLMVANDVTQPGAGFDGDTNIVTLVDADSEIALPLQTKVTVAGRICDRIVAFLAKRGQG